MRRGVTLIEVIVVLIILAMLSAFAITIFLNSNRDLGVRAAANHCVALVRSVGEHARATHSPAWIVLNVQENSVHTLTEETIQAWNFEDNRGAFGRTATMAGGGRSVAGREGLGYLLTSSSTIDCGEIPVYTQDQGLGIEFWIYRVATRGRQTICTIGQEVEVSVDGAGKVYAKIGGLSMNTKDMYVPMEKWVHVKAAYSGSEGKLYLNDVEADVRQGKSNWTRNSPLVIGSKKDGLTGVIDSFRVSLIIPRDKYYLPNETKFVLQQGAQVRNGEFTIGFTPQGRLDPARHPGDVSFTLKSPADEKTITISPLGSIVR